MHAGREIQEEKCQKKSVDSGMTVSCCSVSKRTAPLWPRSPSHSHSLLHSFLPACTVRLAIHTHSYTAFCQLALLLSGRTQAHTHGRQKRSTMAGQPAHRICQNCIRSTPDKSTRETGRNREIYQPRRRVHSSRQFPVGTARQQRPQKEGTHC